MSEPQTQVNVTQKRGCTCCGTGCGIVAATTLLVGVLIARRLGRDEALKR